MVFAATAVSEISLNARRPEARHENHPMLKSVTPHLQSSRIWAAFLQVTRKTTAMVTKDSMPMSEKKQRLNIISSEEDLQK